MKEKMYLSEIYQSNASHIDADNINLVNKNASTKTGIFPVMARINHSCIPNTNFFWREDKAEQAVVAVQKIGK